MTVSTTTSTITQLGNGVTTAWTFPFIGVATADISVKITNLITLVETDLVLGQYSVVLNAAAPGSLWGIGGTVNYPLSGTPMPAGYSITITREVPYTQNTSIANQGPFYPQVVEQGLDLLELQIQQVEDQVLPALAATADAQAAAAQAVAAEAGAQSAALASMTLPNYIAGLVLSTAGSSATFGVSSGGATNSTNLIWMILGSAYTKTTSAWAVGTGNGSLDTGAIAANTWYHVFLIKRSDTGVVDILTSLSTTPALPFGYTYFRRLGSMKTNGSSQWILFTQKGNLFTWDTPVTDINTAVLSTSPINVTLSVPSGTGIQVYATLRGFFQNAGNNVNLLLTSALETSTAAGTPTGNVTALQNNVTSGEYISFGTSLYTSTTGQIRMIASAASTTVQAVTTSWVDLRGQ